MCEAAVIRRLMPLFNKNHNPLYFRYNRVLGIDDNLTNDREAVVRYLELWDDYCATGLYGFALPPAIYRLIKAEATDHKTTVSEELTSMLEALFAEDIPTELEERTSEEGKTNLVTTMEYAMIHHSATDGTVNNRQLEAGKWYRILLMPDANAQLGANREIGYAGGYYNEGNVDIYIRNVHSNDKH
jgi:hypothetical protein